MAVQFYECLFLLDPNRSSADLEGSMAEVNGTIERHGGEIFESRHWGEPKMVYPIKKFRKGAYILTYFKAEPKIIKSIEHDFGLNDLILRYLVLKIFPKIAVEIQSHLRGEVPEGQRHEKMAESNA